MAKDPFAPDKWRVIHDTKTNRTFKLPIYAPAPPFKVRDRKRGNKYA